MFFLKNILEIAISIVHPRVRVPSREKRVTVVCALSCNTLRHPCAYANAATAAEHMNRNASASDAASDADSDAASDPPSANPSAHGLSLWPQSRRQCCCSKIVLIMVAFGIMAAIAAINRQTEEERIDLQLEAGYKKLREAREHLQRHTNTNPNHVSSDRDRVRREISSHNLRQEIKRQQEHLLRLVAMKEKKPIGIKSYNQTRLPPARSSHAVLYHGAYFRVPSGPDGRQTWGGVVKCTDFFQSRVNHEERLHRPLRAFSANFHIFLHTYSSGCPERDAALLRALKPTRHEIEEQKPRNRIVDSYLASLRLLRESKVLVDFVTLTRFDLLYRVPISSLNIDWERININWKAEPTAWHTLRTTSDLFAVMPQRFARSYADALVWSGHFEGPCCHGAAHWVYEALARDPRVGESNVSFIEKGYFPSTQDIRNASQTPRDDLFLGLIRNCPTRVETSPRGHLVIYSGLQCKTWRSWLGLGTHR